MTVTPAESALGIWLGFGVALLILAGAGWLAWRRSRSAGPEEGTGRLARTFFSAALFGVAIALQLGAVEAARAGWSWRFLPMMALAGAVFTVVALLLFGLADFWLGLARPRRSRPWLAGAMLVFALLVASCLALVSAITGDLGVLLHPAMVQIVAFAAAAGLVWWAWLPAPRADVASRFE